jgi:hypothetical protein
MVLFPVAHWIVFSLSYGTDSMQAQTPEQRMRNQKFAKENTARMGKPESAIKKKDKDLKSPISPVWLGMVPRPVAYDGTNKSL